MIQLEVKIQEDSLRVVKQFIAPRLDWDQIRSIERREAPKAWIHVPLARASQACEQGGGVAPGVRLR